MKTLQQKQTPNIENSDTLIANFMGHTVYDGKGDNGIGKWKGQRRDYNPCELKYHTSWDWLMPVVEKIIQSKYEDDEVAYLRTFGMLFTDGLPDTVHTIMVRFNRQPVFHGSTLIEATYEAVIEFIKFYNQNYEA